MRSIVLALLLFSIGSCGVRNEPLSSSLQSHTDPVGISEPNNAPSPIPGQVIEYYSEESRIGRSRRNKIEIEVIKQGELRPHRADNVAIVRFYSLTQEKKWELRQTLEIQDNALMDADPQFTDFTGDHLNDVTFISGSAARGANEVRTLLIYNKKTDKLIHIENSEEYPNIAYNKKLKCIDAWRVYGGTATDFAKIEGNRLKIFATVENFDGYRTVTTIDSKGRERVLRRDKISDDDLFTRYTNFNPLDY